MRQGAQKMFNRKAMHNKEFKKLGETLRITLRSIAVKKTWRSLRHAQCTAFAVNIFVV
jgi:hypothetical protein